MKRAQSAKREVEKEVEKLPRRDFVLLPLISLLTIIVLLVSGEIGARVLWPEQKVDSCSYKDSSGRMQFRPNCTSRTKAAEGPWVENTYNECGYRSPDSCGPKPSGSIRVVVLSTSGAFGAEVPYAEYWGALAAVSLSEQCHRKVQVLPLATPGIPLTDVYRRTGEALGLNPDLLLLVLDPFDIHNDISPRDMALRNEPTGPPAKDDAEEGGGEKLRRYVVSPLKSSRAILIMQHALYQDPTRYLSLYLLYGDFADYLRQPFSPRWEQRFGNLDLILGDLKKRSDLAATSLAILLLPSVAQVALMNSAPRPHADPRAFGERIAAIASSHGIPVIDPLPEFAVGPDSMKLVYPVDGHVSPAGEVVVARVLSRKLLALGYPGLAGCTQPVAQKVASLGHER